MIITRSPLRITLGGGGTDLPSYYNENEGFLISAAIDKYVYVSLLETFTQGIFLKYSKFEQVKKVSEIKHPIIREAFKILNLHDKIEVTSLADIPAGTGLGSSGSFTTALLKALHAYLRVNISQKDLAELACYIELDCLKEPIGKQDQYISSFGGLTSFTFHKHKNKKKVTIDPLKIKNETLLELEDNLLLFFTGFSRSASKILKDQNQKSKKKDQEITENLNFVKELGYKSKDALESGKISLFGELMNEHWENKKKRSLNMSNSIINEWYNIAIKNGALGGKLVGAGGGGFLMFLADDKSKLRKALAATDLQEVRFRFDFEGTKLLMS